MLSNLPRDSAGSLDNTGETAAGSIEVTESKNIGFVCTPSPRFNKHDRLREC